MHAKANAMMKSFVESQAAPADAPAAAPVENVPAGGHDEWSSRAQAIWAGST